MISITPNINVTGGLLALKNLSEIYPYATHPIIPAKVFKLKIAPLSINEYPLASCNYNIPQLLMAYLVIYIAAEDNPNIQTAGVFRIVNCALEVFRDSLSDIPWSFSQSATDGNPNVWGLSFRTKKILIATSIG